MPTHHHVRVPAALAALLLAGSVAACGGTDTATDTASTITVPTVAVPTTADAAEATMPDVVGMTGDKAKDALTSAGITTAPTMTDEAGAESVWDASNWSVTEQDPAAGTKVATTDAVTLTVHHDSAEQTSASAAADGSMNSQGLSDTGAAQACGQAWEDALQKEYPSADVEAHWIAGVLAQELQSDDRFFIKLQVSVDNADYDAECYVGGSQDSPAVEAGSIY